MALSLKITCEKIGEIDLRNYECSITLDRVILVEVDDWEIEDLINCLGRDSLMDAIGKKAFMKHFMIEEEKE